MKVKQWDNEGTGSRSEFETDISNMREITRIFGRTEDTLELYTDNGKLVAVATWPQGSRVYKYCYGKNLDPNPVYRVFVY